MKNIGHHFMRFLHRIYSFTKILVSITVEFLEWDGFICLDDKTI